MTDICKDILIKKVRCLRKMIKEGVIYSADKLIIIKYLNEVEGLLHRCMCKDDLKNK